MLRYLAKRLLQAPLILFTLATLSFALMTLAPGDPLSSERQIDATARQAQAQQYHLDKPVLERYRLWMTDLLRGDLGESMVNKGVPVTHILKRNLGPSLILGIMASVVALSLGIGSGLIAAVNQQRSLDYATMALAVIGISLPTFIIGPLLQLVVGMKLHWLPVASPGEGDFDMRYWILPALTLGLPFAARISRLTRAGMLEVLSSDFVRTAKAKGLPMWRIIWRHCLRGGLLPVVSYLGPAATMLATGSLVVERIFQIPGLGREFVQSALNRDYFLVMGTVMLYGVFIVIFNLLADIAYAWLDPRVRYQ